MTDPTENTAPFVTRRAFLIAAGAGVVSTGVILPIVLSACSTGGRSSTIRLPGPIEPKPEPVWRPAIPREEPIVRVRVAALRGSEAKIELGKTGDWLRIREVDSLRRGIVVRGPIHATIDRNGWVIEDAGGLRELS